MMIDTAVMPKNVQQRITGCQVLIDHVSTVYFTLDGTFAQHQQPCGMVDLRINQYDADDSAIANRTAWLQWCEVLYLLQYIRRCIEQYPVDAVTTYTNRRLRTFCGLDRAFSQSITILAIAIPLRKTTTCACA